MLTLLMAVLAAAPASASVASFEGQLAAVGAQVRAGKNQDPIRRSKLLQIAGNAGLPDAERVAAIKELRAWAPGDKAVATVLQELAASPEERLAVRLRSLKSLGMAVSLPSSNYTDTIAVLLAIIRDPDQLKPVRAMAIKALHWATVGEVWIRREMLEWLPDSRPLEIREAALWALASAANKPEAAPALRAAFLDAKLPLVLRLQGLKSLYPVADAERGLALAAARDGQVPVELRETAVLFLSGAAGREEVKAALDAFLNDGEPRLRAAARTALDPARQQDLWVYFRLRYDPVRHNRIDVLELE